MKRHFRSRIWLHKTALLLAVGAFVQANSSSPLRIGTVRQLFVDEFLIAEKRNTELKLNSPIAREVVLRADKPWEGQTLTYPCVFKDGDKYRLYYRASGPPLGSETKREEGDKRQMLWSFTALAESSDGIHWTKPNLGIVDFQGSKQNNLIWPVAGQSGLDLFPFKDANPQALPDERYKALANAGEHQLVALASPDGIRWRLLQKEPVLAYLPGDPMMDPPNLAFWDETQQQYVAYLRNWLNYRIRGFRRSTSKDFRHWTTPVEIAVEGGEIEHLYTNMTTPYERAPGLYFMFAKRFVPWRRSDAHWPYDGLSEIVLLSSRDGQSFERTFMEPFVRPGLDPLNWHERAIMMGRGILQTSPTDLSLYYFEHYRSDSIQLRRATLRPDGFISMSAPYSGGEFTTKPLVMEGAELELNFSSSVAGSIRVEVQDEIGKPIPGFRLQDCDEIFGDQLERVVTWRRGHADVLDENKKEAPNKPSDLARALKGKAIRLRFVMKAADLYSFRFR
jgi:hypothetical protein